MRMRYAAMLAWAALACPSCGGTSSEGPSRPEAIYRVEACPDTRPGQAFRIKLIDAALIAEADSLIGRRGVKVPTGLLGRSDGGFNAPLSWHIEPRSITFENTAEPFCDACSGFIGGSLDFWIDGIRKYCPSTAVIMAREK